jgi:hypothetical protein
MTRIASLKMMSVDTVRRVFAGKGNPYSRQRVVDACRELGLPMPDGVEAPTKHSASRSGTASAPHIRKDGQATRSTTVHLPVDLHGELRVVAAERGLHMSAVVEEAARMWLFASKIPKEWVPADVMRQVMERRRAAIVDGGDK